MAIREGTSLRLPSKMTISSTKRSFIFNILRTVFAIFLIVYLLNKFLFSEIVSYISSSSLIFIAVACVFSMLFQIIVSYRLKLLAEWQGIPISIYKVFKINLIATFYGLFLPAKNLTGGAIRFYGLSKVNNKKAEALASIILDRIFATMTLILVGALFWPMDRSPETVKFGYSFIFIFGISVLLIILFSNERILDPLQKILELMKLSSFNKSFIKFYSSINRYRTVSLKSLAGILILSVFIHLLDVFTYFLLTESLGLNVPIVTIGWIRSATILATIVPVTISGFGVREGVLIFLLAPYGVAGEQAFALSILVFMVTTFFAGIIGGLFEIGKMIFKVARWKST